MINELERLLSNNYAPLTKPYYSAIVKCKDKSIFGGVLVENNIYKNYIYAEEAAISNAISHGYQKGELDSLYLLVSSTSLNDLKNLNKNMINEFFEADAKVYLYDINRNSRVIKVGNLINNIY